MLPPSPNLLLAYLKRWTGLGPEHAQSVILTRLTSIITMAYNNPANHGYSRTQETELELLRAIEQRENMSSQGYYQPQQQPYYGQQGGYGAPPPQPSQPPYGYAPPPQHNQGPPPPPQYVPNYNANEKQDFAQTFKVEKPKWNDLWAGILFIIFVLGFAAISAISLRGYASSRGTQGGGIYDGRNNFSLSTSTMILFAIVLAVAIVFSYAYVWLARLFPKQFIWVTGILNILMGFATAAYFLYRKQYGAGIVFLIFVILLVVAFITWIPRIPFSALMLRTAVDVAKNHGHVYLVSALGGLLGAAFGAWYSVTLVAVYVRYQPGTTNSPNPSCSDGSCSQGRVIGFIIFLTFTAYWVSEWIKNTIHTTIAGVYGSWYVSLRKSPLTMNVRFICRNQLLTLDRSLKVLLLAQLPSARYPRSTEAILDVQLWQYQLGQLDRGYYQLLAPALLNGQVASSRRW